MCTCVKPAMGSLLDELSDISHWSISVIFHWVDQRWIKAEQSHWQSSSFVFPTTMLPLTVIWITIGMENLLCLHYRSIMTSFITRELPTRVCPLWGDRQMHSLYQLYHPPGLLQEHKGWIWASCAFIRHQAPLLPSMPCRWYSCPLENGDFTH